MSKSKKPKNSSINSSIRQNTADTNLGFEKLLKQQEDAMGLQRQSLLQQRMEIDQALVLGQVSMKQLSEIGQVIKMGVDDARLREENLQKEKKAAQEAAEIEEKLARLERQRAKEKEQERLALEKELQLKKQAIEEAKRLNRIRAEEARAVANLAKSMQTFKSLGDRFSDMNKKLKDNFGSMSALKVTALKSFNLFGIFNKSIAKEKFIQQQRRLGSEDDRSTLKDKFEAANKTAKEIKKNEEEISNFKKDTGLSEEQFSKTKEGKRLLSKRQQLSDEYSKSDLKASLIKQESPTQQFADSGQAEEADLENQKKMDEQSKILQTIADNTGGKGEQDKIKPKEDSKEGGGLLGKLMGGGGAGKALSSLKDFGVGIILVAGALWVASKAFQSFAEVEWEDVGKGIVALGALVLTAIGLDKVKGSIIKGAFALGVLGLALWGVSAAFKEFADLEWGTIGKGIAAIIALGVVGAVLGAFAGFAIAGGAALAALGAGLWVVGKAFQEVGEAFNIFVDGIERLSNIGFKGLAGVAAGMVLLGGAMAAFGAGSAVAGLSSLVTGFLSKATGQKSPVDQLIAIGEAGDGIGKAGAGMQQLGAAMKAFSGIKKEDLKALDAFPWEKATKFVAAGGHMSANGAVVTNASKANADEAAKADGAKGGNTSIVNAPVNNSTHQNQIIKAQIRNQESSQSRYISNRYGII